MPYALRTTDLSTLDIEHYFIKFSITLDNL